MGRPTREIVSSTNFFCVGTQIDFRFTINSRYDMTLSFGYALGYLDSARNDEEFIVSLKIL